ncbi:MAG: protein kinase domain-containing protein [Candidatus Xenobia bacterium]
MSALLYEAEEACAQRQWDLAIEKLEAALQEDPSRDDVCDRLAHCYAIRGMLQKMVAAYFHAVGVLEEMGEFNLAVEVCTRILKAQPYNDQARLRLILLHQRRRDDAQVLRHTLLLARLYHHLGNPEAGISTLQDLAQQQPGEMVIGMELAEMYLTAGRVAEATDTYQRLAQHLTTAGQLEQAAEAWRQLKLVNPTDEAGLQLGLIYAELGKLNEAEAELRVVVRRNLNHLQALQALGTVCHQKGQFRDAILAFTKVLNMDADNIVIKERLADCYESMGNLNEALKQLAAAARQRSSEGNSVRAIELWHRIIGIDPAHGEANRQMAAEKQKMEQAATAPVAEAPPPEPAPATEAPPPPEPAPAAPAPAAVPMDQPLPGKPPSTPSRRQGKPPKLESRRNKPALKAAAEAAAAPTSEAATPPAPPLAAAPAPPAPPLAAAPAPPAPPLAAAPAPPAPPLAAAPAPPAPPLAAAPPPPAPPLAAAPAPPAPPLAAAPPPPAPIFGATPPPPMAGAMPGLPPMAAEFPLLPSLEGDLPPLPPVGAELPPLPAFGAPLPSFELPPLAAELPPLATELPPMPPLDAPAPASAELPPPAPIPFDLPTLPGVAMDLTPEPPTWAELPPLSPAPEDLAPAPPVWADLPSLPAADMHVADMASAPEAMEVPTPLEAELSAPRFMPEAPAPWVATELPDFSAPAPIAPKPAIEIPQDTGPLRWEGESPSAALFEETFGPVSFGAPAPESPVESSEDADTFALEAEPDDDDQTDVLSEVYDFSNEDFSLGSGEPPPPAEVMLDAILFGSVLQDEVEQAQQPEEWLPALELEAAPAAPEPVAEAAPEPVAEAAPEPVAEAAPEPVAEAAPEPVTEAAPEPVAEAAPEPVHPAAPEPERAPPFPGPALGGSAFLRPAPGAPQLPPVKMPPPVGPRMGGIPLPPTRVPLPPTAPMPSAAPVASTPVASDDDFALPSWAASVDEPSLEPPPPEPSDIQFTVYRPRVLQPVQWYPFLAFAHVESLPADETPPLEQVKQMVLQRLGRQATDFRGTTEDGGMAIGKGSELTFVPIMAGVEFNPPRVTFRFQETIHMQEFRMRAALDMRGQTAHGSLQVLLGAILIADVPFNIRIDPDAQAASQTTLDRDSTRPFRKIYASYSPMDSSVVDQFRRYATALGDRWLPGPEPPRDMMAWDERLQQAIQEADVFQLFWSHNALDSDLVEQEVRYALQTRGPEFVRPTYWEDPIPMSLHREMPPAELLTLPFFRIAGPGFQTAPLPIEITTARRGALAPGTVLQNRYAVMDIIGRGGMGTVYEAEDQQLANKRIAVKELVVLATDAAEKERVAGQFHRETELLSGLEHPGVVAITDAFEENNRYYLVMSLVHGRSLHRLVAEGLPTIADALDWMLQLCDVLQYLHDRTPPVIFRDLKPSNIMLDERGAVRLIDFGISKLLAPDSRTSTLIQGAGTVGYSPPEQYAGTTDQRSDIYAMGATLYNLLTGQTPAFCLERIQGTTELVPLQTLNPAVRPALAQVVERMLALPPDQRYQSALEVRQALLDARLQQTGDTSGVVNQALTPG